MEWREPVMINSNWYVPSMLKSADCVRWMEFKDTPDCLTKDLPSNGDYTSVQLHRASGFITNLLNFKDLTERFAITIN
jgi:hypothetical protein